MSLKPHAMGDRHLYALFPPASFTQLIWNNFTYGEREYAADISFIAEEQDVPVAAISKSILVIAMI